MTPLGLVSLASLALVVSPLSGCAASTEAGRPGIAKFDARDALRERTRGDLGQLFTGTDEAAVRACEWLWQNVPEAKQWEFCGVLFKENHGSGGIRAGRPVTTGRTGHCTIPLSPEGSAIIGTYHNHLLTNIFSEMDTNTAWAIAHYLCSPDGGVLKHEIDRGTTRVK